MIRWTLALLTLVTFGVSACALKTEPVKTTVEPVAQQPFKLPSPPPPPPQTPTKKTSEPIRIEMSKTDEKFIILNFENTDIKTIIATFGELLNMNYIVSPGVAGNITIQSYKKFPLSELFSIFQTILEMNGLTAVKESTFYKIVPIDSAKQMTIDVKDGKDYKEGIRNLSVTLDPTFVTQLIPLENIKATDVANILRNFAPRGTDIYVYEPTNMIIVSALPSTLNKFMKIVEAIDIRDTESEGVKTFVYHVVHGQAKKLEEILRNVYSKEKTAATPKSTTVAPVKRPTPATKDTATSRPSAVAPTPSSPLTSSEFSSTDIGDITITAYDDLNALIIKCTPRAYLSLLNMLRNLDVPPKQVLIDVIIAELGLSNNMQYGLQWLLQNWRGSTFGKEPTLNTSAYAATVSGTLNDLQFKYILSGLEQSEKFNVVASPHILAMDNKESEITIGNEVPTATGVTESPNTTSTTTTTTSTVTTSNQIQYKTVGTKLKVTPRITDKGNVSMDLFVESSYPSSAGTTIGTGTYPSFFTRQATTFAVVQDGHTLFLGGLIYDKVSDAQSGIPLLGRIPVLGGLLFGSTSKTTEKTELIVMVTPHVINNQEEADNYVRQFQEKVKTIRLRLNSMEWQFKAAEDEQKEIKDKEKDKEPAKQSSATPEPKSEKKTETPSVTPAHIGDGK